MAVGDTAVGSSPGSGNDDVDGNRVDEIGGERKRRGSALSGLIEIDLGRRGRVRVDSDVDADALRRVLDVLAKR